MGLWAHRSITVMFIAIVTLTIKATMRPLILDVKKFNVNGCVLLCGWWLTHLKQVHGTQDKIIFNQDHVRQGCTLRGDVYWKKMGFSTKTFSIFLFERNTNNNSSKMYSNIIIHVLLNEIHSKLIYIEKPNCLSIFKSMLLSIVLVVRNICRTSQREPISETWPCTLYKSRPTIQLPPAYSYLCSKCTFSLYSMGLGKYLKCNSSNG